MACKTIVDNLPTPFECYCDVVGAKRIEGVVARGLVYVFSWSMRFLADPWYIDICDVSIQARGLRVI